MRLIVLAILVAGATGCVSTKGGKGGKSPMADLNNNDCDPFFDRDRACYVSDASKKTRTSN